jgi:hypothetical protein
MARCKIDLQPNGCGTAKMLSTVTSKDDKLGMGYWEWKMGRMGTGYWESVCAFLMFDTLMA